MRSRQTRGVVYEVGLFLKIPELRPIAWPTWNASAEEEGMDKTNEIKRSKVGQWLAGMLSVLSLFAPARASSLDASCYFSDAKTIDFVESLQRGSVSR